MLELFIEAVTLITVDQGFKLPSKNAQTSVSCAKRLLRWAQDNKGEASDFATNLVHQINNCFKHTRHIKCHTLRKQLWENCFKLCSSDNFQDTWDNFLQKIGFVGSPIFFQYITTTIMESLIKSRFSLESVDRVNTETVVASLHYEDRNALQYCAGYVIHSLMKKLQRLAPSPHQVELVLYLTELVTESEL